MNEATVIKLIRLEAARLGIDLWRNNSGACKDITGRLIRYGLANESGKLNKYIKSSDLIGSTPVNVYMPDRGWVKIGLFTAIECKHSDWVFNPNDEREVAQLNFHEIVRFAGGLAGFARSVDDFKKIVGR